MDPDSQTTRDLQISKSNALAKLFAISSPSKHRNPNTPVSMSTTVAKGQSVSKPSALQPVALLDTPKAKAYSIARPLLLLGGLALRLPALISDPVSTLNSALPFVVVIQVTYAVTCLPVAGSQGVKVQKKPRPGERKKQESNGPNLIKVCLPEAEKW